MRLPLPDVPSKMLDHLLLPLSLRLSFFLDEDLVCQATPRPTESKPEQSDFISACIHLERTAPQRPALRRGEDVPNARIAQALWQAQSFTLLVT